MVALERRLLLGEWGCFQGPMILRVERQLVLSEQAVFEFLKICAMLYAKLLFIRLVDP